MASPVLGRKNDSDFGLLPSFASGLSYEYENSDLSFDRKHYTDRDGNRECCVRLHNTARLAMCRAKSRNRKSMLSNPFERRIIFRRRQCRQNDLHDTGWAGDVRVERRYKVCVG